MPEKKEDVKLPVRRRHEMVPWYPPEVAAEIDRLYGDIFPPWIERRWPWPDRPWPSTIWPWGVSRMKVPEVRAPYCDLIDMGKEYKLRAEIPGIPKDKIDITIDRTSVEISAEAKTETDEEKKGYVSRERTYSSLYRSMAFPEEVVPEKAKATYQDGILELRVPKKTPTEMTKHKVQLK
jgi:HSP20 family protein